MEPHPGPLQRRGSKNKLRLSFRTSDSEEKPYAMHNCTLHIGFAELTAARGGSIFRALAPSLPLLYRDDMVVLFVVNTLNAKSTCLATNAFGKGYFKQKYLVFQFVKICKQDLFFIKGNYAFYVIKNLNGFYFLKYFVCLLQQHVQLRYEITFKV